MLLDTMVRAARPNVGTHPSHYVLLRHASCYCKPFMALQGSPARIILLHNLKALDPDCNHDPDLFYDGRLLAVLV